MPATNGLRDLATFFAQPPVQFGLLPSALRGLAGPFGGFSLFS
jgi:hypothetical protein